MAKRGTISEHLFIRFCEKNAIPCHRVPTSAVRTPDFRIDLTGGSVGCEVTQLDDNDETLAVAARGRARGSAAWWDKSNARIRNKIGDKIDQLRYPIPGCNCRMLVLYDNVAIGSYDATAIRTAMFGNDCATFLVTSRGPVLQSFGPGGGRTLKQDHYTEISAVASLREAAGNLSLHVFHNMFAIHPFEPDWLRLPLPRVQHFRLAHGGMDWEQF